MSKFAIPVGEEFPLDEGRSGEGPGGEHSLHGHCRHRGRHDHHHRRHHHHGYHGHHHPHGWERLAPLLAVAAVALIVRQMQTAGR